MHILAAEDNALCMMIMDTVIRCDGHQITHARTGKECLSLLKSGSFDVAIIDYNMGDLDGGQIIEEYRAETKCQIPIFFITAAQKKATEDMIKSHSPKGILHKPFTSDSLNKAKHLVL